MNRQEHRLDTGGRRVLDVTELVLAFCSSDGRDGLVNVFVPHATAGVALMETGSGSEEDLQELLERILPRDDRYRLGRWEPGPLGVDDLLVKLALRLHRAARPGKVLP